MPTPSRRRFLLSKPPLAQQIAQAVGGSINVDGLYLPSVGQSGTGGVIDSWACALGIGPAWSFTSTARPSLTNGVLGFDGVNDTGFATGAALAWSQNVGGLTLLAIAETTATATASGTVIALEIGTSTALRAGFARDTVAGQVRLVARRLDADSATAISAGVSSTTALTIDVGVFDYANGVVSLFQNGTQVGSTTALPSSGPTSNTPSTAVGIGSNGANFFHGQIAAIGCFVGALPAATILNLSRIVGRALNIPTA